MSMLSFNSNTMALGRYFIQPDLVANVHQAEPDLVQCESIRPYGEHPIRE
jgi:hypothetical protein